jgi:hypothetical protein
MRKLIAGFILMIVLPIVSEAQAPNEAQRQETVPVPSSKAVAPGSNPGQTAPGTSAESADTQTEAFNICLRATQRFEQREQTEGSKKPAEAPLSASCKTELKPLPYWQCMEKEANQDVDFNTAHWRCAKQNNLLK